jgi:hypothetical protein
MAKIKCINIACKFNSAVLTKNNYGTWDSDVEAGICNCEEDIELIAHTCPDCENEDEGIDCKNFEFKPYLHQGKEE